MSAQQVMQHRIIEELCDTIRQRMLDNAHKLPEAWDGLELRQWFADIAADDINYKKMDRHRMRDYRNERLVRNL